MIIILDTNDSIIKNSISKKGSNNNPNILAVRLRVITASMPKQGDFWSTWKDGAAGLHQKMDPDGSDEGMDRQKPWFRNGSIQDLKPLLLVVCLGPAVHVWFFLSEVS